MFRINLPNLYFPPINLYDDISIFSLFCHLTTTFAKPKCMSLKLALLCGNIDDYTKRSLNTEKKIAGANM